MVQMTVFGGVAKAFTGHACGLGLRMDAKELESGGNRWYISLQPKGKLEIPAHLLSSEIVPVV